MFFEFFMISSGFQFDYELNSKNHSKKIDKILDFVWIFSIFWDCFSICFGFFWFFWIVYFDFFWFFSISIGFQLDFLYLMFLIFFDVLNIFSISIGFQFDFLWFQLDFNWIFLWALAKRQAWEKKQKKRKKSKTKSKILFNFFDFKWFNSKI